MRRNRILNCLSEDDFVLLRPHLRRVPLQFRQCLQAANRPIRTIYFPETGIASVTAISRDRSRWTEVALVGRDGMTGIAIVLEAERPGWEIYVQIGGQAQCISVDDLRHAMNQSEALFKVFLRYTFAFAAQCAETALANAVGTVQERLARWLLMMRDRVDADDLPLTHEFIALMLGVRRAGVTAALQRFVDTGVIETRRGVVIVRDRRRLEDHSRGLYGVPQAE
jgi:CRP-like cAMP-binding protein